MCRVYIQGIITEHQVQNWFSKFRSCDTAFRDEPRPWCSSIFDQDALSELVEWNICQSTREFFLFDFKRPQLTICHHLKKIGQLKGLGVSLSHTFREKHKEFS